MWFLQFPLGGKINNFHLNIRKNVGKRKHFVWKVIIIVIIIIGGLQDERGMGLVRLE